MFLSLIELFHKSFPYVADYLERRREARRAALETRRRQLLFVRPRLEGLEDRVVPSQYAFMAAGNFAPSQGSYTDINNWAVFVPNIGWQQATQLPGGMDTADIPSGASCVLDSTTDQAVAGLSVEGSMEVDSKLSATTLNAFNGSTFSVPTNGELDVLSSADFGGTGSLGGKIDTSGSTIFDPTSTMTLSNGVSLIGPGTYFIYGPVTVAAALNQTTTMVLDSDGGLTSAGALLGPGSLSDNGDFDWDGGAIALDGGATFIASADLKIEGSHTKILYTTLTNQCNASELGGTGELEIRGGTFDNQGNPIAELSIPIITTFNGGSFINEANAFLDVSDDVTFTGNFTNRGWLTTLGGSTLTLINDGFSVVDLSGTLQLNGDVIIEGAAVSTTGLVQNPGAGILKIGDPSAPGSLALSHALFSGFVEVTSSGTLTSSDTLTNNGKLTLDTNSMDSLDSYLQTSDGTLVEQAAFAGGNTTLLVSGSAQLSGTLDLDFVGGYTPAPGDSFLVVKAGSILTHFNTIPDNMTVNYGPTTVTATEN